MSTATVDVSSRGSVHALLMGADGAFITGSDVLMDGGVTASCFYGELAPPGGDDGG